MAVGHTKFQPDTWFGLLKRSLRHRNIDTVLDIEGTILSTGIREHAGALGTVNNAHISVWTHCPFTYEPIVPVFEFKDFLEKFCEKFSGQSLWYDIKFFSNGNIKWRSSPCGDNIENNGYIWIDSTIIKNPREVREPSIHDIRLAKDDIMTYERHQYLAEKVRPFVSPGGKVYLRHTSKGVVNYRHFLCSSSTPIQSLQDELKEIQEEEKILI